MSCADAASEMPALLATAQRVLVVGQPPHGDVAVLTLDPKVAMRCQVQPRFDAAIADGAVLRELAPADQLLLFHNLAAHLEPGGLLSLGQVAHGDLGLARRLLERCGFELIDDDPVVARRTRRLTIHDLVAAARARLARVTPEELFHMLTATDPVVVLDTRTPTDRDLHGVVPGSIHAPRTVIEWLVDPASGYSHSAITGFDQVIVVVCNEGYSSSLAAATLQDLGFHRATDLVGGVAAWKSAGFSVENPRGHHCEPVVDA